MSSSQWLRQFGVCILNDCADIALTKSTTTPNTKILQMSLYEIVSAFSVMFSNYQETTELMVEHSKNIFSNCIYCWPSILLVYWDWEGGAGGEGEEKNIWGCLCCSLASGHADSPASVMTTSIDSIYRINKHPVLTLWKTERTLQNTTYYNCYGFTFVKFFNYNKSVLYNTVHIS